MRQLLLLAIAFVSCVSVAQVIASPLGISFMLAFLGCLLLAYALLSAGIAFQRYRLRKEFESLSPEKQEALQAQYPEFRYARPRKGGLSARTATWIGAIWINGPLIPLMVAPLAIRQAIYGQEADLVAFFLVLLGFLLAWGWWSINVTLWRRWAARQGVDPDELQWRGENAAVLWRKGSFLERSELGRLFEKQWPLVRKRKSEIVDGIEIKGSAEFLRRTKEALTLLRATPFFQEIQKYIAVIKEGKRSGMKAYAMKPTYVVGGPTWRHSALWYAGTITHDCYHSKLYHEAKANNRGRDLDPDAWTGTEAEKKCLAFQRQALEALNADEKIIAYVKDLEKNPTYQGHNKGWRAWWDYLRRWW